MIAVLLFGRVFSQKNSSFKIAMSGGRHRASGIELVSGIIQGLPFG